MVEKEPEGVVIEEAEPQLPPPLEEGVPPPEEIPEKPKVGKVPLYPALIRLPVRLAGRAASEMTGYPGFTPSEEELNDLVEVWTKLEILVNPVAQAIIVTVSLVAGKVIAFGTWRRMGKPGDLRKVTSKEKEAGMRGKEL